MRAKTCAMTTAATGPITFPNRMQSCAGPGAAKDCEHVADAEQVRWQKAPRSKCSREHGQGSSACRCLYAAAWNVFITELTARLYNLAPIDSGADAHQDSGCAQTTTFRVMRTSNRGGAMPPGCASRDDRHGIVSGCGVAANSRTAASGAAYRAASVRHGPPWPLPASASRLFLSVFEPLRLRNAVLAARHPNTSPMMPAYQSWDSL